MTAIADSSPLKNILIIGKTGAGKASIANAVFGEQLFEIGDPVRQKEEILIRECPSANFKVAIISTSSTQDEHNLHKNISYVLDSLKTLNLVLFVLQLEPVDSHLKAHFEKAISCLGPNASTVTAICLTGCDYIDNDQMEAKIKEELLNMTSVITFAEKGFHMVSLPRSILNCFLPSVDKKKEDSKKILKNLWLQAGEEVAVSSEPDPFVPKKTVKNILIFGKIGAGKSTVANAILGVNYYPVGTSIQSTTRKAKKPFPVNDHECNDCIYKVVLIDIFDTGGPPTMPLPFLKEQNYDTEMLQSVSLILFVSKYDRFTKEEGESFQAVMTLFGSNQNASSVTALVITCCEQKSEQAREKMKHQLRTSTNVAPFSQKGIFMVGLPNLDEVPLPLRPHLEKIKKIDEENLRSLTNSSRQKVSIQLKTQAPNDTSIRNSFTNFFKKNL